MKKLTIAFGLLGIAFGALIIHHSQHIIITVLGEGLDSCLVFGHRI